MPVTPGTRLGPYEICGPLGAGGMGELYRARDTRLNRDVAIKVLPAHLSEDADRLHRFELEARAAGAMNHPNVVAVFDVGVGANAPYLVTELLEGETLRDRLRSGPLTPAKALDYATQMARGLAAAHEKGIVHRDLKPENIFIKRDGLVKLLDFGLAKLVRGEGGSEAATVTADTQPGTVLGTLGYMSPEQVRGEPAGPSSDVFSFGAVLYEMLSGRPPFATGTASETMAAILRDDPPRLSNVRMPPALGRMIRRCLEKRAGERFQSAHDLALSLDAISDASPAPLPIATAERRVRWRWVAAAVLAAAAIVAGFTLLQVRGPGQAGIPSVAVLPLQNLAGDPGQEYLSDGMTEALITSLASIKGLRVISRTSVMRYKGTTKSVREIARELNVAAVMEGSVQQSGDRVLITANLIDGRSDGHLWSDTFHREMRDVLALQSEVAQAIARAIRVLSSGAESGRASVQPIDPEAYRLYLQARYALNTRTEPEMNRALALLQQVLTREPAFALAHAAIAEGYSLLDDFGWLPPEVAYPKAIDAARRALEIAPDLAEAHATLGHIFMHQRRWDDAKRELRRAIDLNLSLTMARRWYSNALAWTGEGDAAFREAQLASELDPLAWQSWYYVGLRLLEMQRYDAAIEQFMKATMANPESDHAHFVLAWTCALANRHDEALDVARNLHRLSPGRFSTLMLAYVDARAGRRSDAAAKLSELHASAPSDHDPLAYNLAFVYMALGDPERALSLLEVAMRMDPGAMLGIDLLPDMQPLAGDPRFQRIVQALRSPAQDGTSR